MSFLDKLTNTFGAPPANASALGPLAQQRVPLGADPAVAPNSGVAPNYQSMTGLAQSGGMPGFRLSSHPGLDVDANYYGGGAGGSVFGQVRNGMDDNLIGQLNSAVQSGRMTQDQANAQWGTYREQQKEYGRALETQSRRNNQQSTVNAASVAASPFLGAAAFAGVGAKAAGVTNAFPESPPGGGMAQQRVPLSSDDPWGANPSNPSGGGLFDTLGNLLPAAGGAYLGNRQRQDVMGQVGKINQLGDSLGGQGSSYLRAITDPYDQQTGFGRNTLQNSLVQRGVGGSSFGNQQLENYDYMRGLGRGDLGTRAAVGLAGTQGQLYTNALTGINQANQNYNNILGAGLGASGSLMNRSGGNILSGLGGLSGIGNSIGNGLTGIGQGLGNMFGSPGSSWWNNGGATQVGLPGQDIANPDTANTGLLDPSMWDPTEGGILGLY